jgi:MFS family permease
MALGVIAGREKGGMGAVMGLLAMAHSLGMLIGPLLAGALLDLSSFGAVFVAGSGVLVTGTALFLGLHTKRV